MLPDPKDPALQAAEGLAPAATGQTHAPICKSEELLRGGKLYIEHGGQIYCLRLTKAGRLLLTK